MLASNQSRLFTFTLPKLPAKIQPSNSLAGFELTNVANLERYGNIKPSQTEKRKEEIRQGMIKKYGKPYAFQVKEIQEKYKATMLQRYGFKHNTQVESIKEKIRETYQKKGKEWGPPHQNKITIPSTNEYINDICKKLNVPQCRAYEIYRIQGEEAFLRYCKEYKEGRSSLEQFTEVMIEKILS